MKTNVAPRHILFAVFVPCAMALAGCNLNFNMVDGYMFTKTGETAESTEVGTFSAGVAEIDVNNRFGNVKIETTDGDPGWKWESKVWADSLELADVLIDELAMDVQTNGNQQTWQVVLPEPTSDLNGVESNLTLRVPANVRVNLTNAHGNVYLNDLEGELVAKNSHGDLSASQIGKSKINVSHGDTHLVTAIGDVTLVSSHGRVEAEAIAGTLSVEGSHSDIKVDQVDADGDFRTSHGKIVATNVVGNVNAKNSHGSTRIETTGPSVTIRSSHGDVELSMNSQSFDLIDLKTSHASIKARLPAGTRPSIDMDASHGNCKSDFEDSDRSPQQVKLRTSHGNIRVIQEQVLAESVQ